MRLFGGVRGVGFGFGLSLFAEKGVRFERWSIMRDRHFIPNKVSLDCRN